MLRQHAFGEDQWRVAPMRPNDGHVAEVLEHFRQFFQSRHLDVHQDRHGVSTCCGQNPTHHATTRIEVRFRKPPARKVGDRDLAYPIEAARLEQRLHGLDERGVIRLPPAAVLAVFRTHGQEGE